MKSTTEEFALALNLCQAAYDNDVRVAQSLLVRGASPNHHLPWDPARVPVAVEKRYSFVTSNQEGHMIGLYNALPICIAVIQGHDDMVKLFLDSGARVDLKDGRGRYV